MAVGQKMSVTKGKAKKGAKKPASKGGKKKGSCEY